MYPSFGIVVPHWSHFWNRGSESNRYSRIVMCSNDLPTYDRHWGWPSGYKLRENVRRGTYRREPTKIRDKNKNDIMWYYIDERHSRLRKVFYKFWLTVDSLGLWNVTTVFTLTSTPEKGLKCTLFLEIIFSSGSPVTLKVHTWSRKTGGSGYPYNTSLGSTFDECLTRTSYRLLETSVPCN